VTDQRGVKRVTAADIARSLGISRATVGFVLNDTAGQTISAATRERVLAEAARLGYRPHAAARALASGQSKIVLLVLPDWPMDHTMRSHLDEASLALDEAGYSLVTMTPHASGHARPLWETLQADVVMGMTPFSATDAALIRASGALVISPDQPPDGLGRDLEFARGPELQIEHLAQQGHTSIVFATTTDPRLAPLAREREELAAATARRLGLALRVEPVDVDAASPAPLDSWLGDEVTAIAAYNDDVAAVVLSAALRSGVRVPEQLAIVGHDDAPLARRLVPSLSTIHVDAAGLGRYMAALALHAIEAGPAPVASPLTQATLVVRESSAPASGSA
jgi:DNA-binding LacI/PurR family transcriptional regulator